MIRPLALDLGTNLGLAAPDREPWEIPLMGRARRNTMNAADAHAILFSNLARVLPDLIHELHPSVLVIERNPRLGHLGNAAVVMLGLRAIALTVAHLHEVVVDEISNSSWQPWARANGWAKRHGPGGDANDAQHLLNFWLIKRAGSVSEAA